MSYLAEEQLAELAKLDNSSFSVQKIFATPHYLVLTLHAPSNNLNFYIGRGSIFQDYFVSKNKPPSELRIYDYYVQYMRKNIKGMRIHKFINSKNDNILHFFGNRGIQKIQVSFYFRGRDLFFAHFVEENDTLKSFHSWKNEVNFQKIPIPEDIIFSDFNFQKIQKKEKNTNVDKYKKYINFCNNNFVKSVSLKKINKQVKKIEKISKDYKRSQLFTKIYSFAKMPDDTINNHFIKIDDLKIKLNQSLNHYQRIDLLFKRGKRLKHASLLIKERLEKEVIILDKLRTSHKKILVLPKIVGPIWKRRNEIIESKEVSTKELIELTSIDNITFAIGKNTRGNDYLRNTLGSKNDLWFHLDNEKSAHGLLKTDSLLGISKDGLKKIAKSLSKKSNNNFYADIVYTTLKNIKPVKGHPGKVIIKKEKHLRVYF